MAKENKTILSSCSFLLFFAIFFIFCGCENPWMAKILKEKTITFNSNGGAAVPSQKLYYGEKIKRPSDPSKSGCTFSGWYEDNETFSLEWDFEKIPDKDVTLYANWNVMEQAFTGGASEFVNWLISQPPNAASDPYTINLNITDTNDFATIRDALFSNKNQFVYLDLSGSYIKEIPNNAFYVEGSTKCTTLIGITVPDSVKSIGQHAFCYCEKLTSVNILGKVTIIEKGTFLFCENLKSIIIPDSVTSIEMEAFRHCYSLTSVTIPSNVTKIGQNAFSNCTSLTSVTFEGNISPNGFNSDAFDELGDLRDKFYASSTTTDGTPGTYTRPSGTSKTWTKQN